MLYEKYFNIYTLINLIKNCIFTDTLFLNKKKKT